MFIKIKDEILEIKQIKRIVKDEETIYKMTDEYKEYLDQNKLYIFFNGNRYTDEIIGTKFNIKIYTYDFDTLIYEFSDEKERNSSFEKIWDEVNLQTKEVVLNG